MGEITQYDMRIYQGIAGRGGSLYGLQSSFTLMKAAGEEEAVKEPETMEPDAEIPKEEPTEPETVSEAPPEEPVLEAPSEEAVEEAAPEPELEPVPDPEPEPVVEEEAPEPEPVVEEEPPAPPPEPEPEDDPAFTFNPETPYLTDGAEPVVVSVQVSGIKEPASEKFYVSIVRKGDNGITIPVADATLRPEGERTATSHS